MPDQVIYLEPNDDIVKLHSRIEWADGRRIILVVPRACRALDAEHEMRLLRRWADEADVQVAIVSRAFGITELARAAAIPVFSSVSQAQRARWRWRHGVGAPTIRRSTALDESLPQPRQPLLDRIGLEGAKLLFTVLIFGLASLVLAVAAMLFVPSARIRLVPSSILVSDSSEVILDPTVTTIDNVNAIVPAGNYREEISGTMTINTSKTATVPADHATGNVVFTNLQGTEATIPLGTIVATTSGVTHRYSTTITATLPSGFNARVSVPVRALKPGPDGNVQALQVNFVEGPVSAVARVINLEPFSGGSIKDVHIVSFDDRRILRERLYAKLREQALDVLQATAEEGVYIVPASVDVIVLAETFDHLVDDPSDTLTMKIDAVASGIYADYELLERFAERRLQSKMPEGYAVLPGTLRVEVDSNARAEGNSAIIRVRSAFLATPVVDSSRLLEGLNWMPVDEATKVLESRIALAQPPEISITPKWWTRLPFFGFRTMLFVEPEGTR